MSDHKDQFTLEVTIQTDPGAPTKHRQDLKAITKNHISASLQDLNTRFKTRFIFDIREVTD